MILKAWADTLLTASAPADIADLHAIDTLVAAFVGLKTSDGRAIARMFAGKEESGDAVTAAVAGIARLSECDDIHLASCVTPGSVVIPVALRFSDTGERFLRAVAAGYAAGLTFGRAIGGTRALAEGVWPTLLAAPMMSAVTAIVACGGDSIQLAHAIALGLQSALARPFGQPMPFRRWQMLTEAVAAGISAANAAQNRRRGNLEVLSPSWLAQRAGQNAVDMHVFEAPPPSIAETSFKPFPIARQGLNALIALRRLLDTGSDAQRIDWIEVFVPRANLALLARAVDDGNRLTRLCNIGFQLACAALTPDMLYDPERNATKAQLDFAQRVRVTADPGLDAYLPDHWAARVVVSTQQQHFEKTLVETDYDSGAAVVVPLLREKWQRLMRSAGPLPDNPRELWREILRHVRMAAESEG